MRALAIIAMAAAVGTVVVVGALATILVRGGISARSEPSQLEAWLGFKAQRAALCGSRDRLNPVAPTPEAIGVGLSHFADHCASCHANDSSGQTEMGQRLYPRAPDMRLAQTQGLTDGELFAIIEDGVRFTGMPAASPLLAHGGAPHLKGTVLPLISSNPRHRDAGTARH